MLNAVVIWLEFVMHWIDVDRAIRLSVDFFLKGVGGGEGEGKSLKELNSIWWDSWQPNDDNNELSIVLNTIVSYSSDNRKASIKQQKPALKSRWLAVIVGWCEAFRGMMAQLACLGKRGGYDFHKQSWCFQFRVRVNQIVLIGYYLKSIATRKGNLYEKFGFVPSRTAEPYVRPGNTAPVNAPSAQNLVHPFLFEIGTVDRAAYKNHDAQLPYTAFGALKPSTPILFESIDFH